MTSYDRYDDRGGDYSRRAYVQERRDDRDPRYLDADAYGRGYPSRELVPRARQDSDLSVEDIRRPFPPPTGRDIRRARSAGPYYDDDDSYYDDRRGSGRRGDSDRRSSRRGGSSTYYEEEERKPKHRTMTKNEKIFAALAGAVLAAGGKELYDRREAKEEHTSVHRNPLSSAALAGVGALAAYQGAEFYSRQQAKKDQKATYILHRGRDGHVSEYYSDEDEGPPRKGHKNFLESALAATGLGGVVKSFTGQDDRSDARSRGSSRSRSPGRGGSHNKVQKAAVASLIAGATEAFRVAKEPGSWKGEKSKRILTAAAGAAAIDGVAGADHGKTGLVESVIGGLVGNRLINGSRNDIEEDKRTGRSRSRSRARSGSQGRSGPGIAALATAGLGAIGAKKVFDRSRSRSRARSRDRSYDSRDGSPDRRRSRSIVDKARDGLAKLGIGGSAAAVDDDYRRRDQDDYDDRGPRRRRYSDEYEEDERYARDRGYDDDRSRGGRSGGRSGGRDRALSRGSSVSSSELGDSDEDEKKHKKMRGKQLITTGLAAVATIHAAHEVYESYEKRAARQKAVREGRLSEAEAKKLKSKALLQDAASVGIAALGIKGAVSSMKEARELQHECHDFKEEKARRHMMREEHRKRVLEREQHRSESWAPESRSSGGLNDGYYSGGDDWRYYDDNPYGAAALPAPVPGHR